MSGYYCCHIGHAVVTHFYIILVAYLVQTVMGRKVFSEQAQKFSANVGFHILAKWWVKLHDVSFSGFPRFTIGVVFILQFTRMPALSHCLHNWTTELDDRIEQLTENQAFITIKDHKPNFPNNIKCRLINPAKSNLI